MSDFRESLENALQTITERAENDHHHEASILLADALQKFGERPRLIRLKSRYQLLDPAAIKGMPPLLQPQIGDKNQAEFSKGSCLEYIVEEFDDGYFEVEKPPRNSDFYVFWKTQFERKPRTVFCIQDATISIDRTRKHKHDFYVFDGNGSYLPELSSGGAPFLFKHGIVQTHSPIGFIDDKFSIFNVCHLWFDKIPRIMELKSLAPELGSFLLLSQNNYTAELSNMLGVNFIGLESIPGNRICLTVPRLYISSSSTFSFKHPGNFCYPFFQTSAARFRSSSSSPGKRLFISRQLATKRRVQNENEVTERLASMGFITVDLEKLSVTEQISLFRSSEFVVGVHGAGLANIIFCPPRSKVLEIFPPRYGTWAYWLASSALDLEYEAFVADDIEPNPEPLRYDPSFHFEQADPTRDLKINVNLLESRIKEMLTESC